MKKIGANMKNIKNLILEAIKGLVTGASMLIAGVSGGTMALILGFYDKLIDAVSNIFKDLKKNIFTILFYMITVGLGFFIFAEVMKFLIENIKQPLFLFFIGAILGSVPMLFKKTRIKVFKITDFAFTIAGILLVFALSFLPENIFNYTEANGFSQILILLFAGILIAIALVLPGISFSHMLLVLGLYESVLLAITTFDIKFLLPLGIATLIGVALMAKLLAYAMKKHTRQTFMVIIGFAIASVADIFKRNVSNDLPSGIWIFYCVIAFIIGVAITYIISRFSKDKKEVDA